MKSSTRSRSSATSGLGVKSIGSSPRPLWETNANRYLASGPAVAGEELAVLLEQPDEVEADHLRQRSLEDPRAPDPAQLWRDGQEELVNQALGLERGMQGRPSL